MSQTDRRCLSICLALLLCAAAVVSTHAQWQNAPMAGAPRHADGTVNMTGPVPRLDGKPDLSGVWQVEAEPRAHHAFPAPPRGAPPNQENPGN